MTRLMIVDEKDVILAKQKDNDAITRLYQAFDPVLKRFLASRIDESYVQDVIQETWIVLINRALDKYEPIESGSFVGYVLKIASHLAFSYDKNFRRRCISFEDLLLEPSVINTDFEEQEMLKKVESFLEEIPQNDYKKTKKLKDKVKDAIGYKPSRQLLAKDSINLSNKDIENIKAKLVEKESPESLSKQYGITKKQMFSILTDRAVSSI